MSDDDFDEYEEEHSAVSGDGALASGFTRWPSLRQAPEHWSETLKRDQSKPKKPVAPTNVEGQDEIRWGDVKAGSVVVPALTAGLVVPPPFFQLLQIRRPARTWSLQYSIEWTNPSAFNILADEALIGYFSVYLGVGSSRIRISRDIAIEGPTAPPIVFPEFGVESSTVDENMPAAELVASVTAGFIASGLAPGQRTFTYNLRVAAAPTTR